MFRAFPKIPRVNREVYITEKLDGSNACVVVTPIGDATPIHAIAVVGDFVIRAQSRTRFITPSDDNYGFAKWVQKHADELVKLGPGHHYGEWWGLGINRGYDMSERRFSLFNINRWATGRPECCDVVPMIYYGIGFGAVDVGLSLLRIGGSIASPGFMNPEGVVVYHSASNHLYKALLENDDVAKSQSLAA